ncbi:MAG: MBG domain-containing protein [Bacteroidota bacterium]
MVRNFFNSIVSTGLHRLEEKDQELVGKRFGISGRILPTLLITLVCLVGGTVNVKANPGTPWGSLKGPGVPMGAPIFKSTLKREIPYGTDYSNRIELESMNLLETDVTVVSKPDWLKIRTGPTVRVVGEDGTPGTSGYVSKKSRLVAPYALACGADGTVYIVDKTDNRICKIGPAGEILTIAGGFSSGFKDGNGADARFKSPGGIAVDAKGYLYVCDEGNNSIRKITPDGKVTTLNRSQEAGDTDGNLEAAKFNMPSGICIDSKGTLYVADRGNNRIRTISPEGIVSTLAGSGMPGYAEGRGGAAKFNAPTGVTLDQSGNLYVADQVNNRIRKIDLLTGEVSTLAGNGEFKMQNGEGQSASFRYPTDIIADYMGNLYVADQLSHSIRRVSAAGKVSSVTSIPGNENKAALLQLDLKNPMGVCFDKSGKFYIADYNNHNIKELTVDALIYGTPSKNDIGTYDILLQATNSAGSALMDAKIVVRDTITPHVVSYYPSNGSTGMSASGEAIVKFDQEISLRNSASVGISASGQLIAKYNVDEAISKGLLLISEDMKSVILKFKDLPAATKVSVSMEGGIVYNSANNSAPALLSWSFTTRPKAKQTLELIFSKEMMYGDQAFKIGPAYTQAGLPIEYSAEDPAIVSISGDTARILKAGSTQIFAFQKGDSQYLAEKISRPIHITVRPVVIQPYAKQTGTYGRKPDIKFDIVSGSVVNGDKFSGQLGKAKGDTAGIYPITAGSLSLGSNYNLTVLAEVIVIQKAPLLIRVQNQTKVAGTANPVFSCSYEGFVNGDSAEVFGKKPEFICEAVNESFIGTYPIRLQALSAANYDVTIKDGELRVLPSGSTAFSIQHFDVLENMAAGTRAVALTQVKGDSKAPVFSFVKGDGDEDNDSFNIKGNSIFSSRPFDYESKSLFTIRVRASGPFGESTDQIITVSIADVNERPIMAKIPFEVICENGTIELKGITAGPEKNQISTILVTASKPGAFLQTSSPENGNSILRYILPDNYGNELKLRFVVRDNGGIANGGADSTVYAYTFKIARQSPLRLLSSNGSKIQQGNSSHLSVNAAGKIQWYFNGQIIAGENRSSLLISPVQSGTVSVQVSSETGCVNEARMYIEVVNDVPVTCTNLISPNYDGVNDAFIVRNIEHYPGNELWITDKTGKIVYHQKNYGNSWKGTFGENALPAGTYYYVLDLGNKTAKMKGHISVID